jgi:ribosomal protein S18 acetylase RimI-like enzyme
MVEAQSGRTVTPGGQILILSSDLTRQFMDQLLMVDRDTLGELWSPAHFLVERTEKWRWSCIAVDGAGRVAGFVIASLKGDVIHCHRVAVRRDLRSQGVGAAMLRFAAQAAKAGGVHEIGCKVARENDRAVRWYRRLGFQVIGEEPTNLILEVSVAALLKHTAERTARDQNPLA